jgi:pimeloyl-ACP methyl ester carboxylesterase
MRVSIAVLICLLLGCASVEKLEPKEAQRIKPVAVMIHGAGGGGWEWDFWKEVFETEGWEVIAPDLMPAEGGLAATRFEDYVAQVVAWCPSNKPFVLIGASMGGILALKAAERVEPFAIVIVNGVPPRGATSFARTEDVPDVIEWEGGPLQDTRDALWDSDEKTILWAHERWRNESGKVLRDIREAEAQVPKVPVLVIASRQDTDIPPEISRELASHLECDYFEYANMSHVGPLLGVRARTVAKHTLEWLRSKITSQISPISSR